MGLFVGRDQRMFSLCLPSSAYLSACSFRGSPRWAFILMKIVRRPWSILSRRSCTMSLIMSASGFPCIEGDFPSPVHAVYMYIYVCICMHMRMDVYVRLWYCLTRLWYCLTCVYVYVCVYMHAYAYGCVCASMILLDTRFSRSGFF